MAVTIADLTLDAAVAEEHGFDSEVTEHPVEAGADVADHVRARPITVTVEGIVSDTPVGAALVRDRLSDTLPSVDAMARLLEIRDAREPVTIVTSLRIFTNMVMQSLSVPRTSRTGDALRFRATFVQVELVTNRRTTVRVSVPRANRKVNRGNKPATPVQEFEEAVGFFAGGISGENAPPPNQKDKSILTNLVR